MWLGNDSSATSLLSNFCWAVWLREAVVTSRSWCSKCPQQGGRGKADEGNLSGYFYFLSFV
jgi:hypothetical protein